MIQKRRWQMEATCEDGICPGHCKSAMRNRIAASVEAAHYHVHDGLPEKRSTC